MLHFSTENWGLKNPVLNIRVRHLSKASNILSANTFHRVSGWMYNVIFLCMFFVPQLTARQSLNCLLKNKNTVKLSKSFIVYFHVEFLERYRWFCVTLHMLEWLSFCLFWNIDLQCIKFNCDRWHICMLWTFFNRLSNSWWREDWQTWSGNFYSFSYSWRASWSGRISKARWIL